MERCDALRYTHNDHPHLDDMIGILQNLDLVQEVTREENIRYYEILEPLADYLRATGTTAGSV